MIYGKLWLVVKPSVGIPLFLGAVAVSSFAVHLTLVLNTPWLKNYYNGNAAPAKAAAVSTEAPVASTAPTTLVAAAPQK
jgi:light-harvesting protein B-800-850 alpha chain